MRQHGGARGSRVVALVVGTELASDRDVLLEFGVGLAVGVAARRSGV
jgi:hypothetical protein